VADKSCGFIRHLMAPLIPPALWPQRWPQADSVVCGHHVAQVLATYVALSPMATKLSQELVATFCGHKAAQTSDIRWLPGASEYAGPGLSPLVIALPPYGRQWPGPAGGLGHWGRVKRRRNCNHQG